MRITRSACRQLRPHPAQLQDLMSELRYLVDNQGRVGLQADHRTPVDHRPRLLAWPRAWLACMLPGKVLFRTWVQLQRKRRRSRRLPPAAASEAAV